MITAYTVKWVPKIRAILDNSRRIALSHAGYRLVRFNKPEPQRSITAPTQSFFPPSQPLALSSRCQISLRGATLETTCMPQRLQQADQAVALLYHARSATPFLSQGGEPCASIPSGIDSCSVVPLRSAGFRDWLTANFYSEFESAPSAPAVHAVLRTLEARAHFGDSPAQKVDYRLSFEGDPFAPSKIFLDLANPAGEILEVTTQGWTVTENLHRSFRRSPGALSLPEPTKPESLVPNPFTLHQFADLFHLNSSIRTRVLFWIASALRPVGPYPILVLRGPAASGKSMLARALRTLIDPSTAPLRRLPTRDRELLDLALHNWILVFDHIHRIPIKISEAVCAISSGEAIETAQPDYRDNALTEIARPIILIAPLDEAQSPWTPTRSLSNRSLTIDLAPIAEPQSEAALWASFEAMRAPALAALADAVSCGLRCVRDISLNIGDLGHVARFPDCAAWAAAAAPVLDIDPASIAEILADPHFMWHGSDPLQDALYAILRSHSSWSGDAAALLTKLRSIAPLAALPSTPKGLIQALARIPGISVSKSKGRQGQHTLSIVKTTEKLRHQTQKHP